MNCEKVEELLLDFIEGELDKGQARAVRGHIDKCPKCRLNMQETRELFAVLEAAKRDQPAPRSASRSGDSSAVMLGPAAWQAGKLLGDFEILGELGRGGMGVVYRARQVSLNRVVALKVLPATVCQSTKAVARFQREARAAAKLHHTNIVPVYAQGEHEGHFYYAMELVEGKGIDWVLRHNPSWIIPTRESSVRSETDAQPADETGATTSSISGSASYRRLALMIAAVAELGVIHRDVKPQNLLLGKDEQLHITDFGLARLLDEPSVTVSGEMLGTPAYMSPEQVGAHRNKIDHRTDIYSLGATLYELLTRRRPFDGAARDQIIARICTDEPKPPRKLVPEIPVDVETICLRAMEKDPRRRYQSAADMAADLRRYAEDRPILSRRVGPIEKAFKWVRRHRALTAIVALSLTVTLGGAIWVRQSIRARHKQADELVQAAFNALAYDDYRETKAARALLDKARGLGPEQFMYRKTLALACLLDDLQQAVDHLEWVTTHRPADTEAMYLLAWALRRNDERDPKWREWLRRAQAAGGATTAAGHFFQGQAVVRNQPDQAAEAYRNATLKKERYAQAHLHLGRALNHLMYHNRKHEDFGELRRSLETACDLQPRKAYPRYLLSIAYRLSAEIYEETNHQEDAEKHFESAIAWAGKAQVVEPASPLGYACEAEYWEARKDYARALAAREQTASRCQTTLDLAELCLQYRWRLYYWTGQPAQAMADLRLLADNSADTVAHKIWYAGLFPSMIQADLGSMEEALRLARSMAESQPKSSRAVLSSSAMLRMLGRSHEADHLLARPVDQLETASLCAASQPATWADQLFAFCLGAAGWSELERAVGPDGDRKLLWAAPHFCAAASALGDGRRDDALAAFRECELTHDYEDYSYLARVFVRKLEVDPDWPPWPRTNGLPPAP